MIMVEEEVESLIFGVDVYWDNVARPKKRVLSGRWEFYRMTGAQMKDWINKCWFSIHQY